MTVEAPVKTDARERKGTAPKPLPAPNSDFYQLADTLNAEELALLKQVRAFMETKVAPIINKYWVEDAFPVRAAAGVQGAESRRPGDAGIRVPRRKRAAVRPGRDGDVAGRLLDRDLLRRPQRPGDGLDLPRRVGGAEAEVAAADGSLGKDRLLRPDRAAGGFRGGRRPD